MRIVALDIETLTPDWGPSCKGWEPERFAPLPYHKPCVVAWIEAILDVDEIDLKLRKWVQGSSLLQSPIAAIREDIMGADRIVTWNGRRFDMPLLNLCAMETGIDWSFWIDRRHRFPNYRNPLRHYDLADQIGDYATSLGLDATARRLGLAGKLDVDGSQVRDIWEDDPDLVVRYCCEDVFETFMIYLRWVLTFESPYDESADQARKWIFESIKWASKIPELKRLAEMIDDTETV